MAEHNSVDSCTWTELKIEIFFDHAGLNLVKIALTFGPYPFSWNICKIFFPVKTFKKSLQEKAISNNDQRDWYYIKKRYYELSVWS